MGMSGLEGGEGTLAVDGPAFLFILMPCPPGCHFDSCKALHVAPPEVAVCLMDHPALRENTRSPTTPATISRMHSTRTHSRDSPNRIIPRTATPMAPIPVHTA